MRCENRCSLKSVVPLQMYITAVVAVFYCILLQIFTFTNTQEADGRGTEVAVDHKALLQYWKSAQNTSGQTAPWPYPERPRPPCAMREIIGLVLYSMPHHQADKQQIAELIPQYLPYFRKDNKWYKSLHNSLYDNNYFMKAQKSIMDSCNKYTFTEKYRATFDISAIKRRLYDHIDPKCR